MSLPRWMHNSVWERILSRRNIIGDCWEYNGTLDSGGYGMVSVLAKKMKVHRVAWEILRGPILEGMKVLHRCDNTRCFNVEHLFIGTQLDNINDMFAKGREANQRGVANGNVKLTEKQIGEILQLLAKGELRQKDIAQLYGVAQTTISYINTTGWSSLKEKVNVAS